MADLIVLDRNDPTGPGRRVEGRTGVSVMETLRDLDDGVAAICGGMCSCATCHIWVDEAWVSKLPPAHGDELELLRELGSFRPGSRLSCQVQFTEALSGLRVTIAPDE